MVTASGNPAGGASGRALLCLLQGLALALLALLAWGLHRLSLGTVAPRRRAVSAPTRRPLGYREGGR